MSRCEAGSPSLHALRAVPCKGGGAWAGLMVTKLSVLSLSCCYCLLEEVSLHVVMTFIA